MCKIPIFTKCCLCAPLREGLLCYGYIHLLFCVLGIGLLINEAQKTYSEYLPTQASVFFCVLLAIDAVFLVILIIACHEKNCQLLKIPQVYNKIWWTLCVVAAILLSIRIVFMYKEATHSNDLHSGFTLMGILYFGLPMLFTLACDICLRSYVILWIKGLMKEFLIQEQLSNNTINASGTRQPDVHTMEHNDVLRSDNEESMDVQICGAIGTIENNDKTFSAENTIEVVIENLPAEEAIKDENTNNITVILNDDIKEENKEKCNADNNIEVLKLFYPKTDRISEENAKSRQDNIELQVLQ